MIQLKNIEKCYQTRAGKNYVLRQITLNIEEGEFVALMGPSAVGKTTLLNILGMREGDWEGEYYLFDHAIHDLKPKERLVLSKQYIGFIFQSFNLLDTLTVYENLDVPLSYRNIEGSERASMVCDTLNRFGIVGKKDLLPSQLSGGQQQLVGVARAVIAHPKLLLADEPTGNLHSSQGEVIMDLFQKLNREGATICMVTHDPRYARHAQRTVHLFDGWIVEEEEAARRPQETAELKQSGFEVA